MSGATPGTSGPGNVTPVLMPQAGQSMEEGTIVRWLVAEGDTVQKGDILFEVETDKAVVEAEATASGRLARILVKEGETVPVKQTVALLADSDEAVYGYLSGASEEGTAEKDAETRGRGDTATRETAQETAPQPSAQPSAQPSRIAASPLARRVAAERGVSLESVGSGSGPHGRIMLCDVEEAAGRAQTMPQPVTAPPSIAAQPSLAAGIPARAGGERQPLSRMRRAIARNLQASKQTVPHFYMKLTIDADPMLAFYCRQKQHFPCSVNDVITLAAARLLMEFPAFRSQIDGDEVATFADANIGIAVGTDDGLVVPVLRGADTRNLKGIAAETRRLVEAARAGKLEGVGEGVFTITNLGMFGVEEFSGIINPPEAAILAVGAAREEVLVKDGAFRLGHAMTLTLSADHRIIDGLLAAKFMARLKELLEKPESL